MGKCKPTLGASWKRRLLARLTPAVSPDVAASCRDLVTECTSEESAIGHLRLVATNVEVNAEYREACIRMLGKGCFELGLPDGYQLVELRNFPVGRPSFSFTTGSEFFPRRTPGKAAISAWDHYSEAQSRALKNALEPKGDEVSIFKGAAVGPTCGAFPTAAPHTGLPHHDADAKRGEAAIAVSNRFDQGNGHV